MSVPVAPPKDADHDDGLETLAELDDWRQYVDGLKS